jgi:ElaB/YqjD/DUF883 family membrane-anchored ribosome-binding protein
MATSPRSTAGPRMEKPDTSAAKETAQDLASDVAKLREDITRLANEIAALGRQSVNTAKRAAAEGVDQLRAQGEAGVDGLRANAQDAQEQLVQTVREKPITSLAVAAGIGFLFALMTRR